MKRISFNNDYGYISLAECIILQAVRDYTASYRKMLKDPENKEAAAMMAECEMFLIASPLATELLSDPEQLLYRLDQEIEQKYLRRHTCSR